MRISELLAERARSGGPPAFSFEFFPPKTEAGEQNLREALAALVPLAPAFVSVTYGAGGSTRERTLAIVSQIKREHGLEAMAHLTCVGATVEELRAVLEEMARTGIENVLALRGDPPGGQGRFVPVPGGLEHASELVALARSEYAFAVGAACFPETHIDAESAEADIAHLAEKVAAGAEFLITQLFFDNAAYFDFLARARAAGITVPIIPGVMPITQVGQIERMAALCGARIPEELHRELQARAEQPEAVLDFGVAYATLQCAQLLAAGAPGIHFYTLNRSPATRAILSALKLARPWEQAGAAGGQTPAGGLSEGGCGQARIGDRALA
ncbi:MAG TPA: methylenetetrahydrofolate reductase [NAD(P)H] [Solirubrobacteraceae bacterium]|nr:methylenetetrahydrofolate reductase [NAD(P)H] [Solirubrobacteraceae bacterium]